MKTIDSAKALGAAARGARIERGLSQQALADLNGLSRKFIGDLESGKNSLELGPALKVASSLGIHLGAPDPSPQMVLDQVAKDIAEELSQGERESTLRIAMDALKRLNPREAQNLMRCLPLERDLSWRATRRMCHGGGAKLPQPWFPGDDTRTTGEAFRNLTIRRTPKKFADFNIFIKDNSLEAA